MIKGTNDGIWDWNIATRENYTSTRWKEILGYHEGELPNDDSAFFNLVHPQSGEVVARQVPEPSPRQKQLLDALKLFLPTTAPKAQVTVGTRKKINQARKPLEK